MDSIKVLSVKTSARAQMVDITGQVSRAVAEAGIKEGICYLYVPHTTAALLITVKLILPGNRAYAIIKSRQYIKS